MGGYAWVTLATNNSYSLGALVLAHSLKKSNTAHKLVVLITSSVSESMRNQLGTVFDIVKPVDVLDSKDEAHLALMQRPELGITFTKIHCWRLVEFEKCVFLDADTLVVRNCDELFEREEFSAAPDASWPDCFNSGVFVFRPSIETFNKILKFAVENKSFDGGDQGLLNQFFSSWATEDIKKHLPFVYNLTSIGSYAYVPAFKHYGSETRIVHFIGTGKPWLHQLDVATKTVTPSSGYEHMAPLLQQWWDLFCEKVHPNLDKNLESSNEGMSYSPVEACSNSLPIALTDEPQTLRLIPCTPHEEKVVTEHNLPFKTNDSSGESPKLESKGIERVEPNWEENACRAQRTPERVEEAEKERKLTPERVEEEDKEEKKEEQAQEEPPPKDQFDYESFFPDESCIKSYLEQNVVTYQPFEDQKRVQTPKEPEPLPRFLTMPEDDRRQSGNVDPPVEKHEPQRESTPREETRNPTKRETPPRETLTKSKSMPFLPLEVTPQLPRSIWKSQPNVNVDPNKKYSMPRLKPIIPKQNRKSVLTKIPKVTHYTEFLMSSDYKDPVNLPKDRIGFVATQLHSQKHKRNKPSVRTKFGPLPFITSPEMEKPASKKIRLEHSDDDLYDLTQCKRQSGNKPKQKDVQKKQNGNNLEEILKRLKEFSKDYQHYFGVIPKPIRRTVMCRNAAVQASGEGECRTFEVFKTVRTAVSSWSRATQTLSQREEFRLFRNYVKDQNEASQKGLAMISGRKIAEGKTDDDEKTRDDDVVIMGKSNGVVNSGRSYDSGFCDHITSARSAKVESTSLAHSGSEVKPVALSKNHLDSVVEEKRRKNPRDDVTESKTNDVSLKFRKSLELSEKCSRGENSHFENEKKLVVHSENHSGFTAEEKQGKIIDVVVQSNGVSLQKFDKDGVSVRSPDFKKEEEPLAHPETRFGLSLEKNQGKNPYVDAKSNGTDRNEEPVAHSKNQFVVEESRSDDVTTPPKKSELGKDGAGPPRVQTPRSECEEKPVVHSKTRSVEENQWKILSDDVTTAQINGASSEFKKDDEAFPRVQNEHFAPSDNRSKLTLEENRVGVDVTTAQNNSVTPKVKKSSEESPETQNSRCGNEEEPVGHSENQSSLAADENQRGDDVTTAPVNLQKPSELRTFGDSLRSTPSRNEDELVEHSKNQSEVAVEGYRLDAGVTAPLQPSGLNAVHSENEESVVHSNSALEQNQNPSDDVTNGFHSGIPDKIAKGTYTEYQSQPVVHSASDELTQLTDTTDDVTENLDAEFHTNSTTGLSEGGAQPENKEASNPTVTGTPGDDVEPKSAISSPVVIPKQNGLITQSTRGDEKVEKPEEILCVPDFETPRSSRVTAKTTEEEITTQKQRKSRSSPKKVHERFTEDSPDESVRFDGKKNSPSGNVQPERVEELKDTSGIAGAIAQLSLQAGSEQTPESTAASAAHQEYLRRQNWETGNIDYMGRDSFDNIWSKICQTLEAKVQEPPTATGEEKKPSETLPEFMETLPGKPAPGPVEDDEIIFSKSDSGQSGLTNISEEEEVRREGVKLSDILEAGDAKVEEAQGVEGGGKAPEVKPVGSDVGVETLVLFPDSKPQPTATAEGKPQCTIAEGKPQPTTVTEAKPQPTTATEAKPQPTTAEGKPESTTATETKLQPATAKETKPQATATEGKPQPTRAEGKAESTSSPTEIKAELPAASVEVTPQPDASDSIVKPIADHKQPEISAKPTAEPSKECKVVAIPSPPILPSSTHPKSKKPQERPQVQSEPIPLPPPDSPSSEQPVKTSRSDSLKDDGKQKKGVFSKILEMVGMKEKNGSEETKSVFYDVEKSEETGTKEAAKPTEDTQQEVEMKESQKVEKKEPETVQPVSKPERSSKDLQQSIQVSETKRKSPSPKLTMPQTPETAVTTPTPPASQEIPPRKNSALLKVEETILETPPVPETSSIQTEIEDIIGKAKTEVETLLQDRTEKETSDMINTMKLIMGEEQEEVEELKVTSEEERKRHKGEAHSSKLSDQILKAIPPPRRKTISDATASTSAIPKATPEQKGPQTAEGKTKSSKPSSIPVPPPRNKGKPQPPTSKGKGKK